MKEHALVPAPEWGGRVRIGALDAESLLWFLDADRGDKMSDVRLAALSIVEPGGACVVRFVEERKFDKVVATLLCKHPTPVRRVIEAAAKLNGLTASWRRESKQRFSKRDSHWRFAHRLALATKRTDVEAMLRELTAKQFFSWQEYAAVEPFDERRQDYRIASVVKALWDIARDRKIHPKPFPLEDFILFDRDETEPEKPAMRPWQEQKAMAVMIANAWNAAEDAKQRH